jgi:hypothetical protein
LTEMMLRRDHDSQKVGDLMEAYDKDVVDNPRILCTYKIGVLLKDEIFEYLKLAEEISGQIEDIPTVGKGLFADPGSWTWDHVVEKHHLQNFFASENEVDEYYDHVWPCVLTHKFEDRPKTGFMKTKESRILLQGDIKQIKSIHKAPRALKRISTLNGKKELRQIARGMKEGYSNYFNFDPIRRQIAENVMDDILSLI